MRVAVACSGLGHVKRGVEAWAADLTDALREHGVEAVLFAGAGSHGLGDLVQVLPCLRRSGEGNRRLHSVFRRLGGWRYMFGSPYEIEQTSFSLALWKRIRRDFDLLHVQDPVIATWLEQAHRLGISRPKVLYANGTGEAADTMRRFRYVQLLTPESYDEWRPQSPPEQLTFMIPNFVDTRRFSPGDRAAARSLFDLPMDGVVVLCASAIRRQHKRVDVLTSEFARMLDQTGVDATLVVAGAREDDTGSVIEQAVAQLRHRVRFLSDVPREQMPDLYRAADIFVLASLHEMFGIVLLEAMASGLPILCHNGPGFRSIVGPAAHYKDLAQPGELARGLAELLDASTRGGFAGVAKARVESTFAAGTVIRTISAAYSSILGHDGRSSFGGGAHA